MRRHLSWALCSVLVLMSCSRSATPAVARMSSDSADEAGVSAARVAESVEVLGPEQQNAVALAPSAPAADRMIVRTASLSMQVTNVRSTVDAISRTTLEAKGFLGSSRLWHDGTHDRASLTVRVPAAALDGTLAALRGLAVRVESEQVSGEDVTRQAVDLRAQLVNLRATETELRALLVTVRQNAKKAAEVLEVHTELTRVRGEIERLDAELQSMTQLAALSTITLDLRPDVGAAPIATEDWQPGGVLRDAARALVGTLRAVASTGIWVLVYVAPLLLLVGAPVAMVWRALRRRGARPVT